MTMRLDIAVADTDRDLVVDSSEDRPSTDVVGCLSAFLPLC